MRPHSTAFAEHEVDSARRLHDLHRLVEEEDREHNQNEGGDDQENPF
jgi:hypothetical protein